MLEDWLLLAEDLADRAPTDPEAAMLLAEAAPVLAAHLRRCARDDAAALHTLPPPACASHRPRRQCRRNSPRCWAQRTTGGSSRRWLTAAACTAPGWACPLRPTRRPRCRPGWRRRAPRR
ncbi:hypothetical protein ACFQU7_30480 [Pseudoroseomonas wenyumeiae]